MPPKKGKQSKKEQNEERAEAELLAGMSKKERIRYEAQKRNAMLANQRPPINENGSYNLNSMYDYLLLLRSLPAKTHKIINEIQQLETNMAEYIEERERPKVNHRVRKEQQRLEALERERLEKEAFERRIHEAAMRNQAELEQRMKERNERIQREINEKERFYRTEYLRRENEKRREREKYNRLRREAEERQEGEQNFNVPRENISSITIPNNLRNNAEFIEGIQVLMNFNPNNDEIRKIYKKLMFKYHPNRRTYNVKATQKSQFISRVYNSKKK